MPGGEALYCSACASQLGPITEDLHDPDAIMEFSEEPINNPETAHIKAVDGPKGPRMQCTERGQMTKVVEEQELGGGDGSGGTPNEESKNAEENPPPKGREPQPNSEVYDLPEDKSAGDILVDVVSNPAYELNDEQIQEVVSWAEIYDGQIPPDTLESVLANLSGISNQKASLMRQKYEAFLNKWIQEQSSGNTGPRLGAMAAPPPKNKQPPNINTQPQQQQQQQQQPRQPPQPSEEGVDENFGGPPHEEDMPGPPGRGKRVERRQEVIDTMAEEAARNMAADAGKFYTDLREIITTLIKRKAERDPEWFFEKADAFGFDIIDELAEPSDAKKQERQQGGGQAKADLDVDRALEQTLEGEQQPQQRQETPRHPQQPPEDRRPEGGMEGMVEEQRSNGEGGRSDHPMKGAPDDGNEEEPEDKSTEEEIFEEQFGNLES